MMHKMKKIGSFRERRREIKDMILKQEKIIGQWGQRDFFLFLTELQHLCDALQRFYVSEVGESGVAGV